MSNKILRLPEVINMVGLSKATIYAHMRNGLFPKNLSLGANSTGWLESEIQEWITARITARDEVA
ncbi:helix-turn-helix transcriptional regulator [Vibrio casei]|uniref:helix-turn-helix transcriptional regulator n=1 Tax=Vibrio casei TaxID=673372 RepID=UPI003F9E9104